jgi:hypothetical protein
MSAPLAEVLEPRRLLASFPPLAIGGAADGDDAGLDGEIRLAAAGDGTIYAAGLFSGTVDFHPGSTVTALTALGDSDIFVARYTPNGVPLWVERFGGGNTDIDPLDDGDERERITRVERLGLTPGKIGSRPVGVGEFVNDLAVDANGDLFVAADFVGTGVWADRVISTPEPEFYDGVVMKLDRETGGVIFLNQLGGAFDDTALAVGINPDNNVVVGGSFARTADFNPKPRGAVLNLTAQGREDGFVATFSGVNGNVISAVQLGGDATLQARRDAVTDLAVDEAGDVFAVGTFAEDADFDPSDGRFELEAEDETDAFVVRLDGGTDFAWAVATGGDEGDGNSAVATSPDGTIVVAGYFTDDTDIVPGPGEAVIRADDSEDDDNTDLLISKLNAADGSLVWAGHITGDGVETVGELIVRPDGAIHLSGGFFGTTDFAPFAPEVRLASAENDDENFFDRNSPDRDEESYDGYVLTLSPGGRFADVAQFAGTGDDFVTGLALDSGKLYVGGTWGSNAEDGTTFDLNPGRRSLPVAATEDEEDQLFLLTLDAVTLNLI